MSITTQQIATAVKTGMNLNVAVQNLVTFLEEVNVLANTNNWQISKTIAGLVLTPTVSSADQAALLASYTALKSTLATLYGQLP